MNDTEKKWKKAEIKTKLDAISQHAKFNTALVALLIGIGLTGDEIMTLANMNPMDIKLCCAVIYGSTAVGLPIYIHNMYKLLKMKKQLKNEENAIDEEDTKSEEGIKL